jgi:2-methylaconitate cis-trans-isomerase PrpF
MASVSVQATWMRGGTSKGLVFRRDWLEALEETAIDDFLIAALGSPDPTQVDGLGGGVSTASKVMIVDPAPDEQGRVRYQFAQVAVETAVVDYGGNCGNMTAAVAAFVVNEGIVAPSEPVTRVTLRNMNTNIDIRVDVPTVGDRAATAGSYVQAGVPRGGAEIICRYLDPGGSVFNETLPTGRVVDELEDEDLGTIQVSIVDVSNPLVFVRASDLGLTGVELPGELNAEIGRAHV